MNSRYQTIGSISILFSISASIMYRQLVSSDYFGVITEDAFTFTSWTLQFAEALKEGVLYPRWTYLDFWEYGSPTFILYSPLAYYLAAFFSGFTDSVISAMNVTKFASLFLTGIGMFYLVKEFYPAKIALLSASFYTVLPYTQLQLYYFGTFASVVSFMWFSPLLLFTTRYVNKGQYKNLLYAGICYGGIIYTHLINAYMCTFVLATFLIYMAICKRRAKHLTAIPLILLTGILISAAYVMPLMFEKRFVNLKNLINEFDYANFFILPAMTRIFPADNFFSIYYNIFAVYVLVSCFLIVLFIFQTMRVSRFEHMENAYMMNKFFLGTASVSIFLCFGASSFLWEIIPFFKYIQFPTRWLILATFSIVFLSAAGFWVLENSVGKKRKGHALIALLFLSCLLLDYKYISAAHVFDQHALLTAKTEIWSYLLPTEVDIDMIDRDSEDREKAVIIIGKGTTEIVEWKSTERIIQIKAEQPATLRVRTFNFLGWTGLIDGTQTEIHTEQGTGAILIDIPEGTHKLELRFTDTPIRYYSKIISVVSLFIIVFYVLFLKRHKQLRCYFKK